MKTQPEAPNLSSQVIEIANRTSFSFDEPHKALHAILKSLSDLTKTALNEQERDQALEKFQEVLNALLEALFKQYRAGEPLIDSTDFTFEEFLAALYEDQIDDRFITQFPFLSHLRRLYLLSLENPEGIIPQADLFIDEINTYFHHHEVMLPIRKMIDFIKLALQMREFEEIAIILSLLSLTFKKGIPAQKRDKKKGEPYYKEVNWHSLERIAALADNPLWSNLLKDHLGVVLSDLKRLLSEFQQLAHYEQATYRGRTDALPNHVPLKGIPSLERRCSDIVALTYMKESLQVLGTQPQDSPLFRLGALRVLTMLGEGMKNLSSDLLSAHPLFTQLKTARDRIIRPKNKADQALLHLLLEEREEKILLSITQNNFQNLLLFLNLLIRWQKQTMRPFDLSFMHSFSFPKLSELCEELTHQFKLTREERDGLLSTFPPARVKKTAEKIQFLIELSEGKTPLPSCSSEFIQLFKGYALSKKTVSSCFSKLKQQEEIGTLILTLQNKQMGLLQAKEKIEKIIKQSVKENLKIPLIKELQEIPSIELLILFINKFKQSLPSPQTIIRHVITEIPEAIDLTKVKTIFKAYMTQEKRLPDKSTFARYLDILAFEEGSSSREAWLNAYERLSEKNTPKKTAKTPDSFLKEINRSTSNLVTSLERIQAIIKPRFPDDLDFSDNEPLLFACEILLEQFLSEATTLFNLLSHSSDYMKQPVDKLMGDLKTALQYRDHLSLFESLYTFNKNSEALRQLRLHDYMVYLALGATYPEAMVVCREMTQREPLHTPPLRDSLKAFQQEISSSEKQLTECQPKIEKSASLKKSLLPLFEKTKKQQKTTFFKSQGESWQTESLLNRLSREWTTTQKDESHQLGWNCFDVAVGLLDGKEDRKKIVSFALDGATDPAFRSLLAPEIKHAAALTAAYLNMKEEEECRYGTKRFALFQWSDALQDKAEKQLIERQIEKLEQQLKAELRELSQNALPLSMHSEKLRQLVNRYGDAHEKMREAVAECNEALGYKEGRRLSLEQLDAFFKEPLNREQYSKAYPLFERAKEQIYTPTEQAFNDYCMSEEIYRAYVQEYYGHNNWFAFHRSMNGEEKPTSMVDIVAKMLGSVIIITRGKTEVYRTGNSSNTLLRVNHEGNNHFRKESVDALTENAQDQDQPLQKSPQSPQGLKGVG